MLTRGVGGAPRSRIPVADRRTTRGNNSRGLQAHEVFEVVLETWQQFPLRLVTAAWATTLSEEVTLERVKATLEALPAETGERGQLLDVSTAHGLREALKELDTMYKEALEFGVHRPSSSADRRSAFEEAFREALIGGALKDLRFTWDRVSLFKMCALLHKWAP